MNFIFALEISKPSFKKTFLFGDQDHPIRIWGFGFFTVITFNTGVLIEFWKQCRESESIDDVWVRLAPDIRAAKKKHYAKARAQAKAEYQERLDYLRDSYNKEVLKSSKHFNDLVKAEDTIKTLTRMLNEK